MRVGEMNSDWEQELLSASARRDEAEQERFLALVDQAFGRCTLPVARVLMKTFSDMPDFGTQERVVSALASATPEVTLRAKLEELPRLLDEAPEWAESLIGEEVEHRPTLLKSIAASMPAQVKLSLRQLLGNKDFRDFYPNATQISI
jgi:hypothetical protein